MAQLLARLSGFVVAVVVAAAIVSNRDHGGMKGTEVPLIRIGICITVACLTVVIVRRYSAVAAPFVAGIAGAFIAGPYSGVLGLFVGTATALNPWSRGRLWQQG